MPEATVAAKGKLSNTCMIDLKLILNDPDLNASLINVSSSNVMYNM